MFGEARQEGILSGLDPKILLFREAARHRSQFGDALAIAGSDVIDHHKVAFANWALDILKSSPLHPKGVERPLHVRVGDGSSLPLGGEPAIVGHFKVRGGFDLGDKLQRLAAAKLDFFDLRVAHHIELLIFERLLVGLGHELFFGPVPHFFFVFLEEHLLRGLSSAEARQGDLLLQDFDGVVESFIDRFGIDVKPHQFFARGQILYRHIHNKPFRQFNNITLSRGTRPWFFKNARPVT